MRRNPIKNERLIDETENKLKKRMIAKDLSNKNKIVKSLVGNEDEYAEELEMMKKAPEMAQNETRQRQLEIKEIKDETEEARKVHPWRDLIVKLRETNPELTYKMAMKEAKDIYGDMKLGMGFEGAYKKKYKNSAKKMKK